MASESGFNTGRQLVLSTITSSESGKISVPERIVRVKKPVALQESETAFIEKTLHYISEIRGAVKTDLVLSTNTRYPTRYIVMVRGLPMMSLQDFQNIRDMNDNIRSIIVCMADESIKIDVWRQGKSAKGKRKRAKEKQINAQYDLSSTDKRDRKCLTQLLLRLNQMDDIECQFDMRIDTSTPEFYILDLHIMDAVRLGPLESVLYECRSFCNGFEFDFPHRRLRARCLRLAAPLKRRTLTIKNR